MTAKVERFCQEIVKGLSKSQAYRVAFKSRMRPASLHVKACRLAKTDKVRLRLAELMAPLVAKAQLTREEWITDAVRLYKGDVRKLFDVHGNVLDLPNLGDSEADMIEGFEIEENFTKVKLNDGSTDAVPTGYTKKLKWTSRKTRHEYVGKALGYYSEKIEHTGTVTVEHLVSLITKKDPTVING